MNDLATVRLSELAFARSGDKGNHANIGVLARDARTFAHLRRTLTAEVVEQYFRAWGATRVERFELPNLHAFNFLIYDALGGGAGESLRIDTQGKLLGTALLALELPAPAADAGSPPASEPSWP